MVEQEWISLLFYGIDWGAGQYLPSVHTFQTAVGHKLILLYVISKLFQFSVTSGCVCVCVCV